MSSRHSIRTLVPVKRQPVYDPWHDPMLYNRDIRKFRRTPLPPIKSEFDKDASRIPIPGSPVIKNEFDGGNSSQTSRITPTAKMETGFCDENPSRTNSRALAPVKREISQEYPAVKIKCEYTSETSFNNPSNQTAIKPELLVKMEGNGNQSSLYQCNAPMPKCKIEPKPIKTFYKCCNTKFDDKFKHFRHMIGHTEEEMTSVQIKCYYCIRYFRTEIDMIRHCKSKHTGFKCMSCSQRFNNKRLLVQHLTSVHNYKPNKNENLNHNKLYRWHRQIWENKAKLLHGEIIKKSEELKLKLEKTSLDLKNAPIFSNFKTEPSISNIKTEPTISYIKTEF